MIVDRKSRRGITLTEILIAIMILGVGLVSLATLFPIGLLRLREATRYTRTAYLAESAAHDTASRGLFTANSFVTVDTINALFNLNLWYSLSNEAPLTQDTPSYGAFFTDGNVPPTVLGANSGATGSYGLPFAYDPLWRYQTINPLTATQGYYLDPIGLTTFEARFGSGIGFIRDDPSDKGLPSAHGLQRLTNFNAPAIMPAAYAIPNIFVSPEDVVWVENLASNVFSPVLPDMNLKFSPGAQTNDWHYSWMFTGYQVSSSGGSQFEGNIVIFENRPFGIDKVANPPGTPLPTTTTSGNTYQVEGETVVEAIFGHSGNIVSVAGGPPGYGAGADRTVLLRWYSTQPDPVVKVGDWIADVTYERQNAVALSRFLSFVAAPAPPPFAGLPNPFNKLEWDNLPAQRCIWYQVQKVTPAIDDPYTTNVPVLRSMVVYVDRSLEARTVLTAAGTPAVFNAALISPYVVNVIPQQFTMRSTFLNSQFNQ